MTGSHLGDLTSPDVASAAARGAVVVVPLGATEQHGPHLPVATDTIIALAIARALAGRRDDVVVAPPLHYGSSGEHAGFAGTLSIGQDAVELVLVELARSASSTFRGMVLVSCHGGNAEPVQRARDRLDREGRPVLVWNPRWGGDAHAGRTETSVMLAVAPDQVRLDRAAPGNVQPLAELLTELVRSGTRAVSPNGVLGDPAGASAEEGRQLLERAVADLDARLTGWLQAASLTGVTGASA